MKLLYLVESGESKFLVFDEMPDKISTKYGSVTSEVPKKKGKSSAI